ncbi:MAG TPA: hypothetical protein VFW78_12265 [Bacteroidia bacterium]|nr:hypothetical protein [Bacteroidia bacterium]
MENSLNALAYSIYLPVVLILTWFVAFTLFRNARIFMIDIFHGRDDLAGATNKLFETGFYLLNVGYALIIMRITRDFFTHQELLEILSRKLGGYSIWLGVMLFLNLFLFFRGRRISKERSLQAQQVVQEPMAK